MHAEFIFYGADGGVRLEAEQQRLKVDIFGHQYTLRGSGETERLQRLAQRVDQKMHDLFAQNPRLDVTTLAILTALNMAEELDELVAEYNSLLDALELEAHEGLPEDQPKE